MKPATLANLNQIRIVYCAPYTLALYGIPYEMNREVGQEPRHLWQASQERPRGMRADLDVTADWIRLDERDPVVKEWLQQVKQLDGLPGYPHEWVRIEYTIGARDRGPDSAAEFGRYAWGMGLTLDRTLADARDAGFPERMIAIVSDAYQRERTNAIHAEY